MSFLKRVVWKDLVFRSLEFFVLQSRGRCAMCLVLLTLLLAVATGGYLRDRSFERHSSSDRLVIHRHIEDVYKRAKLNSDGTLSVKVHSRKVRVTRVVGYQLLEGGQKWNENEASFRFNTSDLLVEKGKLMAAEFLLMARPNLPTQPINVTLFISQTMPKQSNMLVSLGWKVLHNNPGAVVSFDVRKAIHYWQYIHESIGELLIRVRRLDTKGGNMSVDYTYTQANFHNGPRKGPCLVVYLAGDSQGPSELPDSFEIESLKSSTQPFQQQEKADGSGRSRRGQDYCRKVDLVINLDTLYSGKRAITYIFPTRINAGLCTGRCSYPLNHAVNPTTNHAVIMLLGEIRNGGIRRNTRPYCVPTHFRWMSMLQIDDNDRTKIVMWKTALANSCGCW